jgi:hypothetical protein
VSSAKRPTAVTIIPRGSDEAADGFCAAQNAENSGITAATSSVAETARTNRRGFASKFNPFFVAMGNLPGL